MTSTLSLSIFSVWAACKSHYRCFSEMMRYFFFFIWAYSGDQTDVQHLDLQTFMRLLVWPVTEQKLLAQVKKTQPAPPITKYNFSLTQPTRHCTTNQPQLFHPSFAPVASLSLHLSGRPASFFVSICLSPQSSSKTFALGRMKFF